MSRDALRPRQRYLLSAAWNGRVWADTLGRYWLDKQSNVTNEFKPLISRGLARPPDRPPVGRMARVVWFADSVLGGGGECGAPRHEAVRAALGAEQEGSD